MGEQTKRFPTLKVTGGPAPQDVKVEVDGVAVPGATSFVIRGSVNDAVRSTVTQIVELEIEVEAVPDPMTTAYEATVTEFEYFHDSETDELMKTRKEPVMARGATAAEAVLHAAHVMDPELERTDLWAFGSRKEHETLTARLSRIIRRRSGGNIVPW